jgi:hypothetical protein
MSNLPARKSSRSRTQTVGTNRIPTFSRSEVVRHVDVGARVAAVAPQAAERRIVARGADPQHAAGADRDEGQRRIDVRQIGHVIPRRKRV